MCSNGVTDRGMASFWIASEFLSTVIMGVSSAMSARTKSSESVRFELLKAEHRYAGSFSFSLIVL